MTGIREPLWGEAAAEVGARLAAAPKPISALDVPRDRLEQQVRALVARQNEQRAAESAAVLQSLLAPAEDADWPATRRRIADRQALVRQATNPNPPEEGQS
jgi:hypothetical protein